MKQVKFVKNTQLGRTEYRAGKTEGFDDKVAAELIKDGLAIAVNVKVESDDQKKEPAKSNNSNQGKR
ncbi:MAG: hypothetical protein IBX55_13495 [Methyloprofundus sp.]|nr:hypothetical protein [Methyloprofundus sp.]